MKRSVHLKFQLGDVELSYSTSGDGNVFLMRSSAFGPHQQFMHVNKVALINALCALQEALEKDENK